MNHRSHISPPTPLRDGEGRSASPLSLGRGVGGEVFSRGTGMTARARTLRANMTDSERMLWSILRGDQLGVRFRRQLVIEKRFIVDFCAPGISLIVEVDGGQHVDSAADTNRTTFLEARGYTVLRFWNNDVLTATEAVAAAIHHHVAGALAARTSPPTPLRNGEGRSVLSKDCA